MREILDALMKSYHPVGLIVYGSYAEGTNDEQSDFDALLILPEGKSFHDTSVIAGVRMDVFGYSRDHLRELNDPDEIIQIHGGRIILDREGLASELLEKVDAYVSENAQSSLEEKCQLRRWCEKMLTRAERSDPEGVYRGHWLLVDSLSVYCQMRDRFYFGPKKTIAYLKKKDPKGYRLFCTALERREALASWISYIFKEIKQECEML